MINLIPWKGYMARKKSVLGKAKTILNLLVLIPTLYSLMKKTFALIGFEARLARRSVVVISVLSLVALILLFSTWLGVLAMLFFYFTASLHWSLQQSMLAIVALNILMLVVVGFSIARARRNLSFPETRKHFSNVKRLRDDF